MARICETSFNGGQSAGITYSVDALFQGVNDGIGNTFRRHLSSGFGPISINKTRESFPLDAGSPRSLIQVIYFVNYGTRRVIMEGVAAIDTQNPDITLVSFKVTRSDGQPDTGGNPKKICKCEPTDQTIQCVGQEGDICCIPTSVINQLCQRLR